MKTIMPMMKVSGIVMSCVSHLKMNPLQGKFFCVFKFIRKPNYLNLQFFMLNKKISSHFLRKFEFIDDYIF